MEEYVSYNTKKISDLSADWDDYFVCAEWEMVGDHQIKINFV